MDMGTGKSRTVIELARLRGEKWDRFFWFCPVSLKETVRQEIQKHTDLPAAAVYLFDDHTTERTAPADAVVYVVGIESMASSDRVVCTVNTLITDRSFVVVDESSYIKGYRAKRTRRITGLAQRARYRMVLTGTPFTQGAVDLFSQMRFLSPKILGYDSFWSFARNHLEYEERKINGRKVHTGRIIRAHNEEYLAAKIAPYVYQVRKDECLDLPAKLYETRYCGMTCAQRDLYEQAKEELLLARDVDDWSPIWIFRTFTALQTIICGFWRRTDPGTHQQELVTVPHRRLDLLLTTVAEIPAGEKMILWAKYQHAVREICAALSAAYGPESVAEFHGALSEDARNIELARWRSGARFLVATQSAGGHGLTLNEAAYTIFYADGFKYAERVQAEDRNHRIGQTRRPVYTSIRCTPSIDDRIATALERKGDALATFREMVAQYRGEGLRERLRAMVRDL
jgi:SNF2 family DNA or RNA helicase